MNAWKLKNHKPSTRPCPAITPYAQTIIHQRQTKGAVDHLTSEFASNDVKKMNAANAAPTIIIPMNFFTENICFALVSLYSLGRFAAMIFE